jgi:hypothetical protein
MRTPFFQDVLLRPHGNHPAAGQGWDGTGRILRDLEVLAHSARRAFLLIRQSAQLRAEPICAADPFWWLLLDLEILIVIWKYISPVMIFHYFLIFNIYF